MTQLITKDLQYYKFGMYGFLKNLKFFEPFLILFLLEKGLMFWQIGVVYSVREITRNIFEIPSGVVADALGRRRTLVMSFIVYCISFVILFFSKSYAIILVGMGVFAFADAFRTGNNKAMIYDYLDIKGWRDQRIRYYGFTRSWSQTGSAVSSLIAAIIVILFHNYTTIFLASVVPYLLNAVLIYSYPQFLEGEIRKMHTDDIWKAFRKASKDMITVLRNPLCWKAININSFHSGYHKAIKEYIQPVIVLAALTLPFYNNVPSEKREAFLVGVIYFIIYLTTAVASRSAGSFSERLRSPERALYITLLLGLLSGMLAGLSLHLGLPWLCISFFLIVYVMENLRKPIGVAGVANKSESTVMASVLSVNFQWESLVAAVIAPILGILVDITSVGLGLGITSAIIILISMTSYFVTKLIRKPF
mgnify:FL=1